jgi:hypothetical protein
METSFLLKASVRVRPHRADLGEFKVEATRFVRDRWNGLPACLKKMSDFIIKEARVGDVDVLVGTVRVENMTLD